MHDLTKQECDKALDRVARFCSFYEAYKDAEHLKLHGELDILNRLIDEHFDSPPLKYEELKAGMWVWNNYGKRWMLIDFIREDVLVADELQYDPKENEYDYEVQYDPNRFYRKEVRNVK